jgi:hypothetical protein
MRQRYYERFAELQADRDAVQSQLDTLSHATVHDGDAWLLDLIPLLADTIDLHPDHIQAALYQVFDIHALYKDDMNQVSLFATITPPSRRRHRHRYRPRPRHRRRPTTLSPRHKRPVCPLAQPPMSVFSYLDHERTHPFGHAASP